MKKAWSVRNISEGDFRVIPSTLTKRIPIRFVELTIQYNF